MTARLAVNSVPLNNPGVNAGPDIWEKEIGDVPAGIRSIRLMLWASLGPKLETVNVYWRTDPNPTGSSESLIEIPKSARATALVVVVAELLAGFVSTEPVAIVAVSEILLPEATF